MAEILRQGNVWHLRNGSVSYALAVLPGGVVAHLYFGPRLARVSADNLLKHAGLPGAEGFAVQEFGLSRLPQEYPSFGLGDLRAGALTVEAPDGTLAVDLRATGAEVLPGKPGPEGLPATFGEDAQTLRLELKDAHTGLVAELFYSIFDDCAAVARSVRLTNAGAEALTLTRAFSLCLDLPDADWDFITLSGAWARERAVVRRPLVPGEQGTSTRSGASSLQTSPFLALARPGADEDRGDVIGAALVYSGNFAATASVDQFGTTRALLGINDQDFAWRLEPGESFRTPEAALVFSGNGIGGMSRAFHALWLDHLLPPRWARAPRPVLLNSWEAAYFDFDADRLVAIAEAAKRAGVELFVMDDGWFGRRDDDTTSLGDWEPNLGKLPGGLGALADRVRALGLQFGLWMEPEMVSPKSELFRAHPDWCIHIRGRESIEFRHQLILDLSRPEVQDFIVDAVSRTLRESGAAYLKWDMNRNFSNIGSAALPRERQRELPHRYMLGLYAVLARLTKAFPDVLFEGCASGGGRFDAGMLAYVPQIWCSDDTDCLERCRIQYGTTLVFPPSAMGSHVSAVPNHQTDRVTPLESRFAVALGGSFGYELDPRRLSDAEQAALRVQTDFARRTQALRLTGRLYRLCSPFTGNDAAWVTVSEDRSRALFTLVRARAVPNTPPRLVRLRGLDPARSYRIDETGEVFGGDELMQVGLCCPLPMGDAASLLYALEAVDD